MNSAFFWASSLAPSFSMTPCSYWSVWSFPISLKYFVREPLFPPTIRPCFASTFHVVSFSFRFALMLTSSHIIGAIQWPWAASCVYNADGVLCHASHPDSSPADNGRNCVITLEKCGVRRKTNIEAYYSYHLNSRLRFMPRKLAQCKLRFGKCC